MLTRKQHAFNCQRVTKQQYWSVTGLCSTVQASNTLLQTVAMAQAVLLLMHMPAGFPLDHHTPASDVSSGKVLEVAALVMKQVSPRGRS
jgi:hypothetical protein